MPESLPLRPTVTPEPGLWAQMRLAAAPIAEAPERRRLYLLAAAIVLVIGATAAAQVRLNAWNQPFYDAIERKDLDGFRTQLMVFFAIAGVLLVLNVSQTGLSQMIRLRLREFATRHLVTIWMSRKRAARVGRVGDIGVNPDQRIHADTERLAELTTNLAVGMIQASILLVSFIGVLWVLSRGVVLEFGGRQFSIPGYMVWAALIYALSGSWLSWKVGRPLVHLEKTRYAREARLRVALVHGADFADDIALMNGEADERRRLRSELSNVVEILRQAVIARVRLRWVTAGYGWVALIVPVIVAAPGYFGGSLTFGQLMMVVGAFTQVQQALRWFVDNTDPIAEWRATLSRVTAFGSALVELDSIATEQVVRRPHPQGLLAFDDLVVRSAHGTLELDEPHLAVGPGERVLLLGAPDGGKSTLFLTIAGLLTSGSGRISLPPSEETVFLSQRPFLPRSSLRGVMTRSLPSAGDSDLIAALERVGLGRLSETLDRVERWDRHLSIGDQERLIYARLLLARPKWLIGDQALDPLDDTNEEIIRSILTRELAESAVLNIAASQYPKSFYQRVVHVICHPAAGGRQATPPPEADLSSGSLRQSV